MGCVVRLYIYPDLDSITIYFRRRLQQKIYDVLLHLVNEYEKLLESGKNPVEAEEKKQFLIDLDAKLWKEECGGEETEELVRKASSLERRRSMDVAMRKDHSHWSGKANIPGETLAMMTKLLLLKLNLQGNTSA